MSWWPRTTVRCPLCGHSLPARTAQALPHWQRHLDRAEQARAQAAASYQDYLALKAETDQITLVIRERCAGQIRAGQHEGLTLSEVVRRYLVTQ